MQTIWGPRKEPGKEAPAAANPLTSSPASPGSAAGANDAGAASINPLWQTPAEAPDPAPEPDR